MRIICNILGCHGVPCARCGARPFKAARVVMATEKVIDDEPLDPEPETNLRDYYEAECRALMAKIANLGPARGFDSQRTIDATRAWLDRMLDAYNRCP